MTDPAPAPPSAKPALSICVATKDHLVGSTADVRRLELFQNFVESLAAALPPGEIAELVVADSSRGESTIKQWLDRTSIGMEAKVIRCDPDLSWCKARNEAAKLALADILFFCDPDLLIPSGFLSEGLDWVRQGAACFPAARMLLPDGSPGKVAGAEYTIVFISRQRFEKSGGWPERKTWGAEDNLFWDRVYGDGPVARFPRPGLFRQWRPAEPIQRSIIKSSISPAARTNPLVAIAATFDISRLSRQTPGGNLRWDGVEFVVEPVQSCDLVVGLNQLTEVALDIPTTRGKWTIVQEPPIAATRAWHRAQPGVSRVFVQDADCVGAPYTQSQGALPWIVGKTFDELVVIPPPKKSREISCVCTTLSALPGHRGRLAFLDQLRPRLPFDRFGRGVHGVADKWDALADWKYSIAMENFSGPHYWTEKLIDCFLAWTLPFYFGCTNLEGYFPEESFVRIDIDDPGGTAEVLKRAIADDWWSKRLAAIREARRLVLTKYQIFPFIVSQMRHT